jgi:hypothetical protein
VRPRDVRVGQWSIIRQDLYDRGAYRRRPVVEILHRELSWLPMVFELEGG